MVLTAATKWHVVKVANHQENILWFWDNNFFCHVMKISLFFFDVNLMLLSEDNCDKCVCFIFASAEFPN
jgi:hypothetical protein